jgi:hypothetical protein
MVNKINKERRRSMNATPHDPATRPSGQEPRRQDPVARSPGGLQTKPGQGRARTKHQSG